MVQPYRSQMKIWRMCFASWIPKCFYTATIVARTRLNIALLTYLLTYILTYLFTYLLIYILTYLFTYLFTYLLTYLFIYILT